MYITALVAGYEQVVNIPSQLLTIASIDLFTPYDLTFIRLKGSISAKPSAYRCSERSDKTFSHLL